MPAGAELATPHLEASLQREVNRLRERLKEMSQLGERALDTAVQALVTRNNQLAYSVILRDQYIDELEKEIDRLCLEFLVRQQPVASLLRFAYAAIKINLELERVGDYAESVARQTLKLLALDITVPTERYVEMGNLSGKMLHDSITAFVDQNAELARKTMETEELVDKLKSSLNRDLVNLYREGKLPFEALNPLMMIARRLERVSDQANNVCEEVLYLCTGEYAKHKGTDQFRVLFVEETNSCYSQMAEALGNSLANEKFIFSSAGLKTAAIDPVAIEYMKEKGVDLSRQQSKTLEHIPNLEHYQVVVVFDRQLTRSLGAVSRKTLVFDWQPATPVAGETETIKRAALENAYKYLGVHIRDLMQAILGSEIESSKNR